MTPIRDLGDWAEDKFSALCSAAGITRNRSSQDRTGWDYLVEFPAVRIANLPADIQPAERAAKIQVKSKAKGRPSVTLKLSNAVRFAKDPSPCFVVLFLAQDGGEPVRIFARRFWEDEIANALRRARLAGDTFDADLHRKTFSISMTEADDHTDDLIAWMDQSMASIGERYGEVKGAICRTVGQEDGGVHGTITIDTTNLQALVDHQIGLPVEAPIRHVTIWQRRFGVDAPLPLFSAKPDFGNMVVMPRDVRVRVRGQGCRDIWLDGLWYRPAIPGLPAELMKSRVVADALEIIAPASGERRAARGL